MDQLCREIIEHGRKLHMLIASQKRLEAHIALAMGQEETPMDAWLRKNVHPEPGSITCSDCLTRLFTGTPIPPFSPGMLPRKKLVLAREAAAFRDANMTTKEQLRQRLVEQGAEIAFSIHSTSICDHCNKSGKTFQHCLDVFFLCNARVSPKRKADTDLPRAQKKVKFNVPK